MLGTVIGWLGLVAPMLGTVAGSSGLVAPMLGTVTGALVSGELLIAVSFGAGGTRKRSSGLGGVLRVALGVGGTRNRSSTLGGSPRGRDPVAGLPTVPGTVAGVGGVGTAVGGVGTAGPVTALGLWACTDVAITVIIAAVKASAVASVRFPIMRPPLAGITPSQARWPARETSNTNASESAA